MKYSTANPTDSAKAYAYLGQLVADKKVVDIKEVKPRRSLNQNSYLYLLIGAFSLATGNSLQDSKAIYKWVNKELYYSRKKMGTDAFTIIRSSADLNKEEMAQSIDRFMSWSAEHGYPLPPATDAGLLMQIENDLESNRRYL